MQLLSLADSDACGSDIVASVLAGALEAAKGTED